MVRPHMQQDAEWQNSYNELKRQRSVSRFGQSISYDFASSRIWGRPSRHEKFHYSGLSSGLPVAGSLKLPSSRPSSQKLDQHIADGRCYGGNRKIGNGEDVRERPEQASLHPHA